MLPERTIEIGGLDTTVVGDPATAELTVALLHGFAMQPADFTPFAHSIGVPGLFRAYRAAFGEELPATRRHSVRLFKGYLLIFDGNKDEAGGIAEFTTAREGEG